MIRAMLLLLMSGFVLQGCIGVLTRAVHETETERLQQLRLWEERVEQMECPALAAERELLVANEAGHFDVDQRADFLAGRIETKQCVGDS